MHVVPTLFSVLSIGLLALDHFHRVSDIAVMFAVGALLTATLRMALTWREHARLMQQTLVAARTDELTGLGNRRSLLEDLDARIADASPHRPVTLMLFDLNGFKAYNDRFGHPAGDALLARLAGRLREAVAGPGTAYRMGGDEFCVLAVGRTGLEQAAVAALSEQGPDLDVSAAFGATVVTSPREDRTDVLRRADQLMYADKAASRALVAV
jgi:diguanylate cyclase (GGDEF)-like protein